MKLITFSLYGYLTKNLNGSLSASLEAQDRSPPCDKRTALSLVKSKLGSGMRGKRLVFSQEWKDNIRAAKLAHGEKHAKGISHKKSGYVAITRGENKHRSEHVIIMEKRLGRKLLPDEVVHHIDGNKSNNSDNNLALVTQSGHARLHRREDFLAGKMRERLKNGRLC